MNTTTKTTESLTDRLARLSEVHDTETATKEARVIEFPLWALLVIYEKANHACYIDYMKGYRALASWLSPIVASPDTDQSYKYKLDCIQGYESGELAKYLPHIQDYQILQCAIEEVAPRLNPELRR